MKNVHSIDLKKSKILLLFLSIISFTTYSQNDFKNWKARQMAAYQIPGLDPTGLDSVIDLTDVVEIDGKKYCSMNTLLSQGFGIGKMYNTYFPEPFSNVSELESIDTLDLIEKWLSKYAEIFGEDNVDQIVDSRGYIWCRIKNIPYAIHAYQEFDGFEVKWVPVTSLENYKNNSRYLEVITLGYRGEITEEQEEALKEQLKLLTLKQLDESIPEKIQAQFTDGTKFYPVSAYDDTVTLDPSKELHNALALYINAVNDKNGMEELKLTSPKITKSLVKHAEMRNKKSILDSIGFLGQYLRLNQVVDIAPVLSAEQSSYTIIELIGSFEIDFSKEEVTPDMAFAFNLIPGMYRSKYGAANVNADGETKVISVRNAVIPIYAVQNSEIGEWRFSPYPFVSEENGGGVSPETLWKLTENNFNANSAQLIRSFEHMEEIGVPMDVIIPKKILIELK